MHPAISLFLARARIADLHGQAWDDKRARVFTAVRVAEAGTFHGQDPGTIAAAHRWLY